MVGTLRLAHPTHLAYERSAQGFVFGKVRHIGNLEPARRFNQDGTGADLQPASGDRR